MYGWQVKLCDPLLTRAIPEHFRDEFLVIKRHTKYKSTVTLQVDRYNGHKMVSSSGCTVYVGRAER